jgi:RNA polymerase sigma-70 factor, ECF subfamily
MAALYARHHVRVYRFLLRFVNDAANAEDLAGDVFLEVWKSVVSGRLVSICVPPSSR